MWSSCNSILSRDDLLDILRTSDTEQGIDHDQTICIPWADRNKVIFRRDNRPGRLEAYLADGLSQSAGQEEITSLTLCFGTDAMQYQVKKSMYVSVIHLPTGKNADCWQSLDIALLSWYLLQSEEQQAEWFERQKQL